MVLYKDGKKYIESIDSEDNYSYEVIDNITVIEDSEYHILDNAPAPFIYGAKKIVTRYALSDNYQKWYNPLTGEYFEDHQFRGVNWINSENPNNIDTLTPRLEAISSPKG